MLQFKMMFQATEKAMKEATEKAVEKVYRQYRKEIRQIDDHDEIMDIIELDMILEDETVAARETVVASVNIIMSLYEYNSGKVKHFAKMHDCETLIKFLNNENHELDFRANNPERTVFELTRKFFEEKFKAKVFKI